MFSINWYAHDPKSSYSVWLRIEISQGGWLRHDSKSTRTPSRIVLVGMLQAGRKPVGQVVCNCRAECVRERGGKLWRKIMQLCLNQVRELLSLVPHGTATRTPKNFGEEKKTRPQIPKLIIIKLNLNPPNTHIYLRYPPWLWWVGNPSQKHCPTPGLQLPWPQNHVHVARPNLWVPHIEKR